MYFSDRNDAGGRFKCGGFLRFMGAVSRHMQAALLGAFVFPPPPAGAEIFAQRDGAGAGAQPMLGKNWSCSGL